MSRVSHLQRRRKLAQRLWRPKPPEQKPQQPRGQARAGLEWGQWWGSGAQTLIFTSFRLRSVLQIGHELLDFSSFVLADPFAILTPPHLVSPSQPPDPVETFPPLWRHSDPFHSEGEAAAPPSPRVLFIPLSWALTEDIARGYQKPLFLATTIHNHLAHIILNQHKFPAK